MTREEDLRALAEEARSAPLPDGLDAAIARGVKRGRARRRARVFAKAGVSLAAGLALLFALGVNLSPTLAGAAARLPGLREILPLVIYNQGLRMAIDNNMLQNVGAYAENNGVSLEVGNVIIDETGFSIFCKITGAPGTDYAVSFAEVALDGVPCNATSAASGKNGNGAYQRVDVLYDSLKSVPATLDIGAVVCKAGEYRSAASGDLWNLTLNIDSKKVGAARRYDLDYELNAAGVGITLDELVVVPTRALLYMTVSPEQAERLVSVDNITVESGGRLFTQNQDGITYAMSFSGESASLVAYLESPYYEPAQRMTLRVGEARVRGEAATIVADNALIGREVADGVTLESMDDGNATFSFTGLAVGDIDFAFMYEDALGQSRHIEGTSSGPADDSDAIITEISLPDDPGTAPYAFRYTPHETVAINAVVPIK